MVVVVKRADGPDMVIRVGGSGEICVRENVPVEIDVEVDAGAGLVPTASVDGAPLEHPLVRRVGSLWIWTWVFASASWCGRSSISIDTGQGMVDLGVVATPDGSKLTWSEYREMLARIVEYGSQLPWGLAPGMETATQGRPGGVRATHPALLDAFLPELVARLSRIVADPVRRLQPKPVNDLFAPGRPTGALTLAWLGANPIQRERLLSGDLAVAVRQWVQEETFDHPANRHVVALLRRLSRSLAATHEAFKSFAGNGWNGELERNRARHLAGKSAEAKRRIALARQEPVLRELPAGDMTESVAQVFADHPAYGSFARVARLLLGAELAIDDEGGLASSLRRTYDLFEIFCLYKLSRDFQHALTPGWTFVVRPPRHGSLLAEPVPGVFWTASHPDGRRWELRYQQTFASGGDNGEFFSLSRERRPDYVLAGFAGARLVHWVLLDAKYRVSAETILDALADMHVYRDSLRWRRSPGTEATTCEAGYLVVPAVSARTKGYEAVEYRQRWRLGLIQANDIASISSLVAGVN